MSGPAGVRRALGAGLLIGAAAGAWMAAGGMPGAARVWAMTLAVLLPLVAFKQVGAIGDPASVPRIPAYVSSIVSLWLIAGLTAVVCRIGGLGPADLRLVPVPWLLLAAWAAGLTAIAVATLAAARRLGVRESPLLLRLLPETRSEKHVFAGLSVTAGFCEELVFRGFLVRAFTDSLGVAAAVAISSVVFGLSHAYQDKGGAARATLLGLFLAIPVVLSGSLWPSILAHTAIDLLGGIFLRHRLVGRVA